MALLLLNVSLYVYKTDLQAGSRKAPEAVKQQLREEDSLSVCDLCLYSFWLLILSNSG